jgi:hypothetical protein
MLLANILLALAPLAALADPDLLTGFLNPVERVSPECKPINSGQHLCCAMTITGDQPIVVSLAQLVGYDLNPNDVNGLACK